ncbi:MAG: TonB-dependent receptor [Thermodesulfovibrionia bacterium]|nr:TonB-dependent receptor [Thermodesulfovibrionia bacterium]
MKKTTLLKAVSLFMLALLIFCPAQNIHASGFAIYTQGADSLGQGNSVTAHLKDPSAIFINPALINKLDGTKLELGTTFISPSREFKSDTGATFKAENKVFFPSTLFVTHKYNEKLSFGLGVFNPFGLGSEWNESWEGRYIATKSELTTININPVVSYQVLPNLAIAAGFDYITLDASLEKKMNFGSTDGNQKFDGDGSGYGFNLGILYDVNNDIAIGASYRSEVEIDVDGAASFSNIPVSLSAYFPNTDGKTTITLPEQIHAGVAYKGIDKLTLEAGIRWEGWSSYDELKFNFDQAVGFPVPNQISVVPKNWDDTISVLFGGEYQLNEMVVLRAGYLRAGNPVPDETFEPSIPDADTDIFTIGTGIKYKHCKFDLAYGFQNIHDRNKNNTIDDNPANALNSALSANGRYETKIHMLGASVSHTF